MWFVSVAFQEGERDPHFCRAGKPPAPFSRFPLWDMAPSSSACASTAVTTEGAASQDTGRPLWTL